VVRHFLMLALLGVIVLLARRPGVRAFQRQAAIEAAYSFVDRFSEWWLAGLGSSQMHIDCVECGEVWRKYSTATAVHVGLPSFRYLAAMKNRVLV
jgi:hypothetical protein